MARPALLARVKAAAPAPRASYDPAPPEANFDHAGAQLLRDDAALGDGLIRDQLPPDPEAHIVTSIEADVAAETVRLEFLKLRPEVNSWLIELSEKRLAALTQV